MSDPFAELRDAQPLRGLKLIDKLEPEKRAMMEEALERFQAGEFPRATQEHLYAWCREHCGFTGSLITIRRYLRGQ